MNQFLSILPFDKIAHLTDQQVYRYNYDARCNTFDFLSLFSILIYKSCNSLLYKA